MPRTLRVHMPEPVPGIVSGFSIKMFTNHGCFGGHSVNFSTNCIIMEKISDEEETKKSHSVTACVTGSKGFYTYRGRIQINLQEVPIDRQEKKNM